MSEFAKYKDFLTRRANGPKLKEIILEHAAHNTAISVEDLFILTCLAYPDEV